MKKIRNFVKKIADKFNLTIYLLKIYFKILAFKYGCNVIYEDKYVIIKKNKNFIKIKRKKNDLGLIGLVVRDFDNFYNSVESEMNLVDFTIPKYHKLKTTGQIFFFHDICEPLSVTDIYIKKANLNGSGEVVIDIGCYCGTQTVFYSELVGENGLVLGFEPDNESFNSLSLNISQSKFSKNIIIQKVGIYNFDGKISFSGNGSMASKIESCENENQQNQIEVKKLDTIAKEYNLQRVDFVKMDIEGSEIEVLKSSTDFINRFKPKFIIEPHYVNDLLNTNEIISILEKLNYNCEILKQGNFDYQPLIFAKPNI